MGTVELSVVLIFLLLCGWASGKCLQGHGLFGTGFALGVLLGPLGFVVSLTISAIKN